LTTQTHENPMVSALLEHRSTPAPLLIDPAPDADALDTMLRCALSAPDHAAMRPWQFITIEGDARLRLGDVFVAAKQSDEALRRKPLRAPLIVAVAAKIIPEHPKTPPVEQILSTGIAAQHIQIAARALGFGSVWLTGPMARHPHVKQALGLASGDEIVGFLYIGSLKKPAPEKSRPELDAHRAVWSGI